MHVEVPVQAALPKYLNEFTVLKVSSEYEQARGPN